MWAAPHLAFFTAPASRRLYLAPDVDPAVYAGRWEGSDASWIGEHSADEVRRSLWPWLKRRGYAEDADDAVLDEFISILGRRRTHLRPALRLHKRWDREELAAMPERDVARLIRDEVNVVVAAAGEPALPGS